MRETENEILLSAEGLSKCFTRRGEEPFYAVMEVSFSLRRGETLGIVGESGCGKSTLVRMLARLSEPSAGRIVLEGQDITHQRGKGLRPVYRSLQMVFQTPASSFDPRRTLGDGIAESLRNNGFSREQREERIRELLLACGLPEDFATRYPHEVSGGQCQRAALARALAIRPRLLICDEATSALDVTVQKQVMELLCRLREKEGLSFLFICHSLALVQDFCDRILVMHKGQLVEEGTPEEIIGAPKTEYTKRLIEAAR